MAQDSGTRRKESHCKVKVFVEDENDNVPQFNINPIITRVREDAKIGHFVTNVRFYLQYECSKRGGYES